MGRREKLRLNTISAIIYELITLAIGFILPRYILAYFGSDINGLTNSISRFLGVIAFMELGIGPVIQTNLYKPLAERDNDQISRIIVSAQRFYRRIALIFLAYVMVLLLIYPRLNPQYEVGFSATLLAIIAASTFAQYYFGITYQVLLNADQKVYVCTLIQIVTAVLNCILSVILIKAGCSIHIVKLVSAIVFIARPLALCGYAKRKYSINHKIAYTEEPIKQKWNGFAQHLSIVVSREIDVILLTIFSTYQNISIYSVYLMIVNGITQLITTAATGLSSLLGNMIAKKEHELLLKTFEASECVIHTVTTFLFSSTAILITPFVMVYINGAADATAYNVPLFGLLLTLSYSSCCLRIPYFAIVQVAGHYKQTQNGSFISMGINIIISLILVPRLSLVGVAGGTLAAMLFHMFYLVWYLRKNILKRSFRQFAAHFLLDCAIGAAAYFATKWITMEAISYLSWVVYSIKVAVIVGIITVLANFIAYRKQFVWMLRNYSKKTQNGGI